MRKRLDRARRADHLYRASRLLSGHLLRSGQRELWHEAHDAGDGPGAFVIRRSGAVEQRGVVRASAEVGAERRCGAVRLHVLVVADAVEAAYVDRCRTAEASAQP